jgi:hypothetical protein
MFSHLIIIHLIALINTGHTQKNGAVSEVGNKFVSALLGQNLCYQQLEVSQSLMRYQQFTSHAYFGAAGPGSKMASQ